MISTSWSPDLACAIGLITSDDCLSKDGRHIDFTSKDIDQIQNFLLCVNTRAKIETKKSGLQMISYRVQLTDPYFHAFLVSIGIGPAKSEIITHVNIPDELFFDFLRGLFDGDGYIHSYWDKRWKSSFMFYIGFYSASKDFTLWLQNKILFHTKILGHITSTQKSSWLELKYSKYQAMKIIYKMYCDSTRHSRLVRKYLKYREILSIVRTPQTKIGR